MKEENKKWSVLTATLLLSAAAPLLLQADSARGGFERTLKVSGPVTLDVQSPYGELKVRAGTESEVRVSASIRAESKWRHRYRAEEKVRLLEENPPIVQEGNRIRIGEINDRDLRDGVRIDYDLVVPAQTELAAATGYGNVNIEGVRKSVRVTTGYGDVDVSRPQGSVEVTTGYGDIGVQGEPSREWRLKTGYGDVRLQVPDSAGFELDAKTGWGSLRTDHPLQVSGSFGPGSGRYRGAVRGGGPVIAITTGFGNIRLE